MDAIKAWSLGAGAPRVASSHRSDLEAPLDAREGVRLGGGGSSRHDVVVDPVTLSPELRQRQEIAEQGEAAPGGDESEAQKEAASAAERERIRELLAQDMQQRTSDAAEGINRDLRGLPSFEYDIGPYGRAYAVGDGVHVERPEVEGRPPELEEPAPPEDLGDADPARALEETEDSAEAGAEAEEPPTAANTQGMPRDAEPRGGDPEPSGEPATTREVERAWPVGSAGLAERTARAYGAALGMTQTTGGTVPTSSMQAIG